MLSIFSYIYCLFIHFLWRNIFSHLLSICELGCVCCALGILWRRKWQLTPVLLPGKSHGWRSLLGYSPWGCKELDTTEQLHFHFSLCQWKNHGFDPWVGNPLEEGMATHFSTLAWRILWTEEPGRLRSMGSQRVRHNWATSLSLFTFIWET